MKKTLLFILFSFSHFFASAQTHVNPPLNHNTSMFGVNKSAGIVADKILADGNRIVYANTFKVNFLKVDGAKTIYYGLANPFAIKCEDKIKYGMSIHYPHHTAVEILDNAQTLFKTADGNVITATAIYGCGEESHTSTSFSPNLFNATSPITSVKTIHNIDAHIVMSEEDYVQLASSEIVKMRVQTSNGSIDIDLKGKKFCKYMNECLPIIKDAISKESSGFDNNF